MSFEICSISELGNAALSWTPCLYHAPQLSGQVANAINYHDVLVCEVYDKQWSVVLYMHYFYSYFVQQQHHTYCTSAVVTLHLIPEMTSTLIVLQCKNTSRLWDHCMFLSAT